MTEKHALLILNATKGLGNSRIIRLIKQFGCAQNVLSASFAELCSCSFLPDKVAQNIIDFPKENFLSEELSMMKKQDIWACTILDEHYPEALRTIDDAPVCLYIKGKLLSDWSRSIAIVGSRSASIYGKSMAHSFSQKLAEQGFNIISGLAKGIDRSAHEGALETITETFAVIGCGLNHTYPAEHAKLYKLISSQGAVISEFPMNTPPLAFNFPRRNRIITGLSKGTLVVEAASRSGALISADFALEQGREVYAIPGPIDRASSVGTNRLIKQGAKLVTKVEDILEDFDQPVCMPAIEDQGSIDKLNEQELAVYGYINERPLHLDEIIDQVGEHPSGISGILLNLELKQLIKQLPGKYFRRVKNYG